MAQADNAWRALRESDGRVLGRDAPHFEDVESVEREDLDNDWLRVRTGRGLTRGMPACRHGGERRSCRKEGGSAN